MIHIQRYTKVFQYIMTYGGEILKNILTCIHIALNIIKLKYVIQIDRRMFLTKNSINILHTVSHKSFPIHYGVCEENF